jgi:hypothetical protein
MRLSSLRFRFRLRTMMIVVGAAAAVLTLELGRERRESFRRAARALATLEEGARVQAAGAASSAGYHRGMVTHGGLDPQTVEDWTAGAEKFDRVVDDWKKQAESMRRSGLAYQHAAASWLPVEPDQPQR